MHENAGKKNKTIWNSLIGIIGFLLSPLSWWNDLVINFPLSYLFALIITFCTQFFSWSRFGFFVLMAVGYWLTNLLGFYLLHHSAKGFIPSLKQSKFSLWISILYTMVVVLFAFNGFLDPIQSVIPLLPKWIT